ncbi:Zeatin O-glucosyltransferase [Bienertia sinuspersici]
MGVPIVAWPMHSDQPRNVVLVSQVLRVGVVVRDWAHQSKHVMSNLIENAVKRLMVSKEGKEMKERTLKLGEAIRGSTTKGGASCLERDAFISYITRDVKHSIDSNPKVVVVMVPLPAQGHLNQLLHLSHLIASYGVPVHYAGSSSHNRQARARLHGWHHHNHDHEQTVSKIEFHDFELPKYDYEYNQSSNSSTNNDNVSVVLPTHLQALFDASTMHLREPMRRLFEQLSVKFEKVVVIHDMLMAYVVQDVKEIANVEAFAFIPFCAFTMFMDTWRFIPKNLRPFDLEHGDIPECVNCVDHYEGCMTPEMFEFVVNQVKLLGFESGWLYNTSRVIEGRYVHLMEKLKGNIKHFGIGPLHPMSGFERKHQCLEWLDKQEEGSVIYVSFGSTTSLTHDQIQELAKGLDECGVKFIWVLRKADSNDVFAEENGGKMKDQPQLPQGYEEEVKNKGIVVRDWAPQIEILAHKSVGGFMSHCGWNSCIESLSMGVPIVAWPMHSDQPRNAVLVSEVLKVGVVVRDWARRSELVMSNSIENAVKRVMVSKEGMEMKERASKLGEAIKGSVGDGGASCLERDAFIAYINNHPRPKVVVLMVPLPVQGHLNPLLHLSHLITSYNIPVHYAGSSTQNHQARVRLQGWHHHNDNKANTCNKIQFHDFQLPHDYDTYASPNSNISSHSIISPMHFLTLFEASTLHFREPMHQLLQQLSIEFEKVIVIHDMLMSYVVQDLKLISNVEAFTFLPISAFAKFLGSWNSIHEKDKPFDLNHEDIPQSYGDNLADHLEGCMTPGLVKFVKNQAKLLGFESGWVYNTSRVIEGRYVHLIEKLTNKKHFAIGPFHPMLGFESNHECLKWLDKQEKGSVIYVSFGSTTSLTHDQIQELAKGLDESGEKFIWVLRKADSNDVFAEEKDGKLKEPQLPQGYEEKVKNKGIVVRDWAPQIEILAHKSVGGFMSHCGWNSCIESLSMGVPIVAWPMHSDQPRNAVLVSEVLKVGVVVRDWARRSELVMSNSIENAVKRVMVSKEGMEMKERASKLGEAIRGSVVDGGASKLERGAFIAYITNQNCNEEQTKPKVVVVMVPLPAQGHLNQLLHLSHLITSYDIPVYYTGSSTHNHQARVRLHGWNHHGHHHDNDNKNNSTKIRFHDFQLPSYDQNYDSSSNSNVDDYSVILPTHFLTLFDTLIHHLREPMHQLLQQLSVKFDRAIVIYDILMAYMVQDVKLIPNVEAFAFVPICAFTTFLDSWRSIPKKFRPFHLDPKDIPQCIDLIDHYEGSMAPEMSKFVMNQVKLLGFESGWLYNTSRDIEGRYVHLMEKLEGNMKHFAIGPFHPMGGFESKHQCLEWLDKQEKGSVIYVSFGSTTSLTHDQIQELAKGLDECGEKFIWVLRKADSNDIFAKDDNGDVMKEHQLPQGYEEKVKNKGIVIRDWAPQIEILAHKSVGGFMSHCGWNSCIESLSMGVSIVAWPMYSDQPRNAIFMSEVLRVGVMVRDWAHRSELVMSNSIENAVKKLMVSKEGMEMKERAVKLGEAIKKSTSKGGASCLERDAFIAYITR